MWVRQDERHFEFQNKFENSFNHKMIIYLINQGCYSKILHKSILKFNALINMSHKISKKCKMS